MVPDNFFNNKSNVIMEEGKEYNTPVKVLVVDDEQAIRDVFHAYIDHAPGYECYKAGTGLEAIEVMKKHPIDVVITDINMPDMDGIQLLKEIRSHKQYNADMIIITGFGDDYSYENIIDMGARDFIKKPVPLNELMVRLKRVVNERALLAERNRAYEELKDAYLDTVNRLALAAEYKDEDTGDHILRMSQFSSLLAEKAGLAKEDVENIKYASPMHDIGKIGIPEKILSKKGMLTHEEFDIIKTHTTIGAKILANSKSRILETAKIIALTHHEKWNGKGYPMGLKNCEIPLSGRIVALMDTFDALTSKRPYKDPYPIEVVVKIIKDEREKHFDPDLTDIFLRYIDDFLKIKDKTGNDELPGLSDFKWSERDIAKGKNKF